MCKNIFFNKYLILHKNINSKWVIDLNVKLKPKFFRRKQAKVFDLGNPSNGFLDTTPKENS